jgi:hypothetical protein
VDATRYYPPRWRLGLLALGCSFLVAVLLLPATSSVPFLIGIGWLGVGSLTPAAVVLLVRALRPGPTVVIDGQGITDRTTLAPTGLVRWDEITVIRKREVGRGTSAERLLEVVLSDPDGFRARPRGWLRRLSDRYRAALRQPAVSIAGSAVSVPMQMVMEDIRQRRPQLQVLEGPPRAPSKTRLLFGRQRQPGHRHPDIPNW